MSPTVPVKDAYTAFILTPLVIAMLRAMDNIELTHMWKLRLITSRRKCKRKTSLILAICEK